MRGFQLTIFGINVSFRAQADPADVEAAKAYVEEASERLKSGGGQPSREKLLVLLALGVAYDLLQSKRKLKEVEDRLEGVLKRINTSV